MWMRTMDPGRPAARDMAGKACCSVLKTTSRGGTEGSAARHQSVRRLELTQAGGGGEIRRIRDNGLSTAGISGQSFFIPFYTHEDLRKREVSSCIQPGVSLSVTEYPGGWEKGRTGTGSEQAHAHTQGITSRQTNQ